jgi:hypothetical protein
MWLVIIFVNYNSICLLWDRTDVNWIFTLINITMYLNERTSIDVVWIVQCHVNHYMQVYDICEEDANWFLKNQSLSSLNSVNCKIHYPLATFQACSKALVMKYFLIMNDFKVTLGSISIIQRFSDPTIRWSDGWLVRMFIIV